MQKVPLCHSVGHEICNGMPKATTKDIERPRSLNESPSMQKWRFSGMLSCPLFGGEGGGSLLMAGALWLLCPARGRSTFFFFIFFLWFCFFFLFKYIYIYIHIYIYTCVYTVLYRLIFLGL